jgi:hypothetical protein
MTVRREVDAFPGVVEGTSYGTLAFRVSKKLFVRFHQDGSTLVVRCDPDHRDALLKAKPNAFYVTDHYVEHPWVLVRMFVVEPADLSEVLEQAWRRCAANQLLAEYDACT